MNYLQPYKGKSTRHTCPACKTRHSFTLYLNGRTNEPIHRTVGRCNRESKCGYHYPPKQYFIDNPTNNYRRDAILCVSKPIKFKPSCTIGTIPFHLVEQSLNPNSNFVSFLQKHFTEQQINCIFEKYLLGATKAKEVIFWQIDISGKVRTGKIMQYNPETGKRIKHKSGAIDWVHNKLKNTSQLPEDFNLKQCFFGEQLLKIYPTATVAIVESEKSAIIASCVMPDLVWLAAGSLNGLTVEKCQVLKNRNIILYPDLGAFEKWSEKARIIEKQYNCRIIVSNLLENLATHIEKINGLDVADYLIFQFISQ